MTQTIDIHESLRKRRQIAIVWSIEDVQEMRPDLDEDQSWIVLQSCKDSHDATEGICWDTLSVHAEVIYPEEGPL